MKINGELFSLDTPMTVQTYLLQAGYMPERVAVEQNGSILPRSQFAETLLADEDTLEIVSFVGGG